MRIPALVPVLVFTALGALAAPAARAEALVLDEELLRDAASMLSGSPEAQAGAALPAMDLLAAQNRSTGGNGGVLRGVGIGLQVGTPTALTFKFGAGANANIVLGVGLGFGYDRFLNSFGLSLHGDYLFTLATLVNNGTLHLDAYVGPGLWISLFNRGYGYFGYSTYAYGVDYFGVAVRVPLGLSLGFHTAPIEIYLELDPALFVFPGVGGFIGASLGFRWFF